MVGHVLVVGSSVSDPTLVQAAEEVGSLMRIVREDESRSGSAPHGTVILTTDDPGRRRLLSRTFDVAVAGRVKAEEPQSARAVMIALDTLALHSLSSVAHLMEPAYDHLLDRQEQEGVALLRELVAALDSEGASAWPVLRVLRERIGNAVRTL